ncbi:hypothetical protein OE88DRAFT_1738765 [Heliocybe sulcata]|uniref:Uncharacterized protein n=1 Tax=Heliocybe sulcata TaxID=5364 RepID=A0A5C3MP43_9AGAM|nr:hypothetical protein OE88DRAFT_1738765 [Heliocybe sulcata]
MSATSGMSLACIEHLLFDEPGRLGVSRCESIGSDNRDDGVWDHGRSFNQSREQRVEA